MYDIRSDIQRIGHRGPRPASINTLLLLLLLLLIGHTVCKELKLCIDFAQLSDWREVSFQAKDLLKSTTIKIGEQFVTTFSATSMPLSSATVWDLGQSLFLLMISHSTDKQDIKLVVYSVRY